MSKKVEEGLKVSDWRTAQKKGKEIIIQLRAIATVL